MIDKIDRKILSNICIDANISNLRLAKSIGLNTATVTKRIDAMVKKDLITIKAVRNLFRLGYKVRAFITLNVDLLSIDQLKAKLIESPNVHFAVTTFGRYDVLVLVDFPDWEKLNSFMREDVNQWPGVRQSNIFLVAEIKKIQRNIFPDHSNSNPPVILDDANNKIIQELSKNGLTSYTELASRLGVNPATISRRVGSLIDSGTIKILAIPNPPKFGYSACAYIMLGTDRARVDTICTELNKYPQIRLSMTLTNGFNIIAYVQFLNPELLYEFIKRAISPIPGITTIETLIVAESINMTYASIDLDNLP